MAAQPQPIWLDCDPGHDDAMAILLAGHSPGLRLLGVSTVASNQTVAKTTRNALDVLDVVGLSAVPVVAGAAKPLMRRTALLCPEIHGDTGLDGPHGGPVLPHSTRAPLPGKAPLVMFAAIEAAHITGGTRVQLIATGALTNVALLLLLFPEVVDMVEVTIMGGALGVGNTSPVAEFNLQVDPEAAKIVFESGVPLTMVPLEVTHTALATPEVLARMLNHASASSSGRGAAQAPPGSSSTPAQPGAADSTPQAPQAQQQPAGASPFKALISQLLTFFAGTYREVFQFPHAPLHDPCAVAAVIAPGIFQFKQLRVDIETASPLCAGQSVVDVWRQSGLPANCRVATAMDVPAFWELLFAAVDAAEAASPLMSAGAPAAAPAQPGAPRAG